MRAVEEVLTCALVLDLLPPLDPGPAGHDGAHALSLQDLLRSLVAEKDKTAWQCNEKRADGKIL